MNKTQKKTYSKPRVFSVVLTENLLWEQWYSATGGVDDEKPNNGPQTTKSFGGSKHFWEM